MTGLNDRIIANKSVILSLYNPGAKGIYQIKVNVPSHELNVVNIKNANINGDIICANLYDTANC